MSRLQSCWRGLCAAALSATSLAAAPAAAQDLASFEKRTTVHTLPNGYTFLIVERQGAPVFSFATRVDVGSAQEVPGITGLAHMFEHMAFKGTPRLGTTDFAREKTALVELEQAYLAYELARAAVKPDQAEVERLHAVFKEKQTAAQQYVVPNAFDEALSREGGVGLNASTSAEATTYYYSLPSNKFELFAYLESERFIHPVFREFYKERDVVMEERRQRTESQPIGRLIERLLATAFLAHPYKQPTVGYMSDLQRFTMTDAEQFFRTYYTPANMVTAIVGNVKASEIIPVLDKYFGRLPAAGKPPALRTFEPPQAAELSVTLREKAQPFYIEAYHKPSAMHPDEPVYDAIAEILGRGRTSRLYTSLVEKQKLAVQAQVGGGLPGVKYPHLFLALAVPARGVTTDKVAEALRAELSRMITEDVTDEELTRFKTRAKADLIRSLDSDSGLASQLVTYHTLTGDWRELFRYVVRMEAVTKADIRRVSGDVFKPANRTVARLENDAAPAAASTGGTR
ncbi:MAG: insulinase family protein [Acidobacteria bacterium]|nr:insulinase family protein [Acidobacteriota bacterium]